MTLCQPRPGTETMHPETLLDSLQARPGIEPCHARHGTSMTVSVVSNHDPLAAASAVLTVPMSRVCFFGVPEAHGFAPPYRRPSSGPSEDRFGGSAAESRGLGG